MPEFLSAPPPVIAIDGPAASGKSTVGEMLAERLGFLYFDTGAMYRAVTLVALIRGIPVDDEQAMASLAEALDIDIEPPTVSDGRQYTVLVEGDDVTWAVRSPEVDAHVSEVSALAPVRDAMVRQQRRVAEKGRVVMVGRDIGTVVFPEAPLKVYLDATPEERALRRFRELRDRRQPADYDAILEAVRRRDAIDSGREASPLRAADDAVHINTEGLDVDQVVAAIVPLARQRLGQATQPE